LISNYTNNASKQHLQVQVHTIILWKCFFQQNHESNLKPV